MASLMDLYNYPGTLGTQSASNLYWKIWMKNNQIATIQTIWTEWTSSTQLAGEWHQDRAQEYPLFSSTRVRTAAEIAESDARRARAEEEMRAVTRRQTEIYERAEALLLSHLTPKQKEDYRKHKYICFKGRSGANYRLRAGSTMGNIDVLDKKGKEVTHRLCAHPLSVPMPDTLLTQLFHLRHHEADFLRIANRH